MASRLDHLDEQKANYDFFLDLPERSAEQLERIDIRTSQLISPLFEYSGACSGCGETPYIKLLTQLYGDRLLIANATGCSSIYGGNLPTTPYTTNADGRGPAWANSLFEDNAEFGLGVPSHRRSAQGAGAPSAGEPGRHHSGSAARGARAMPPCRFPSCGAHIQQLRELLLQQSKDPAAQELARDADYLVEKSVWLIGGDGWAPTTSALAGSTMC